MATTNRIIFNYLSKAISDPSFTISSTLQTDNIEELDAIQELLFEFYFLFLINAKRETRNRVCSYGLDCIRLKLRAIFVLMNEEALSDCPNAPGNNGHNECNGGNGRNSGNSCNSRGMIGYMQNVDGLLLTTDKRRENTREYHNCKGNHNALNVVCAYNDAKRLLEHPIFTPSMCRKIIDVMTSKIQDYARTCNPSTCIEVGLKRNIQMNQDDDSGTPPVKVGSPDVTCGEERLVLIPSFQRVPSLRKRIEPVLTPNKGGSPEPSDPRSVSTDEME